MCLCLFLTNIDLSRSLSLLNVHHILEQVRIFIFSFSFVFVVGFFALYVHVSLEIGIFVVCMINNDKMHVKNNNRHQPQDWCTSYHIDLFSLAVLLFHRLHIEKKRTNSYYSISHGHDQYKDYLLYASAYR
jgi:hypothetical protein